MSPRFRESKGTDGELATIAPVGVGFSVIYRYTLIHMLAFLLAKLLCLARNAKWIPDGPQDSPRADGHSCVAAFALKACAARAGLQTGQTGSAVPLPHSTQQHRRLRQNSRRQQCIPYQPSGRVGHSARGSLPQPTGILRSPCATRRHLASTRATAPPGGAMLQNRRPESCTLYASRVPCPGDAPMRVAPGTLMIRHSNRRATPLRAASHAQCRHFKLTAPQTAHSFARF